MIEYTGPVPKTPSPGTANEPASTAAEWQAWFAYKALQSSGAMTDAIAAQTAALDAVRASQAAFIAKLDSMPQEIPLVMFERILGLVIGALRPPA